MSQYDVDGIILDWDRLLSDPAVDWKDVAEVLYRAVTIDDLTEKSTYRVCKADVHTLEKEGKPVGILYADGYLKPGNDAFGKPIGNEVIKLQHDVLEIVGNSVNDDSGDFCRVYRESGDESILFKQCCFESLENIVYWIKALYREMNRYNGSYILGYQPSLTSEYGLYESEVRTLARDTLSKYDLPPELPLYVTIGYSHSTDGQKLLEHLSEARAKQVLDKIAFYEKFPELNPRGQIDDIISKLRMLAETRKNSN